MNRKRTRIIVSIAQSLVFLLLASIVLYFGLHTLEGLLPIIIVVLIALVLIITIQQGKFFNS